MKFTKEDAIKELVAKLTANGEKLNLSTRSINEQIEALLPLVANEEMECTTFVDAVMPLVKTADANVRNDVSQSLHQSKNLKLHHKLLMQIQSCWQDWKLWNEKAKKLKRHCNIRM